MTVLKDPGIFHDDGERDSRRHHERIRKQIAQKIKETIGEEKLITLGPDKKIRVPIKDTKEYRFIFDRGQQKGVGQSGEPKKGDQFKDGEKGKPGAGEKGEGGAEPGEVIYEVELDMEEVETHLFEQLGLPRLAPRAREQIKTEAIYWDDRARKGPILDKKATIRENMLRNAKEGHARIGGFENEDRRFLTYRESMQPKSQAVIFMIMDVSGSMGQFEKKVARLFFWWATRFLKRRYSGVDLVFIAHDSTARECTEEEFFGRASSGGTICSTAYEKLLEIQRTRYPVAEWNIYVTHCSDGDNYAHDNEKLVELIKETAKIANLIGYVDIKNVSGGYGLSQMGLGGSFGLYDLFGSELPNEVVRSRVMSDNGIWKALQTIFSPDDSDLADKTSQRQENEELEGVT